MRYLNDVLLNLDDIAFPFYDWSKKDPLIKMKKIPLVHICEEDYHKLLQYKIKALNNWLEKYQNQAIVKKEREKYTIIIFTTKKDNIAIEFNQEGIEIARSRLQIEDDLNAMELACSLPKEKISYQKLEKIEEHKELKRESFEKKIILTELKTLHSTNNKDKLSYLYYEWFSKVEENVDKMLADCQKELEKPCTSKIHEIANLIKLSYKEKL